jgi:hypothetical protein
VTLTPFLVHDLANCVLVLRITIVGCRPCAHWFHVLCAVQVRAACLSLLSSLAGRLAKDDCEKVAAMTAQVGPAPACSSCIHAYGCDWRGDSCLHGTQLNHFWNHSPWGTL